MIRALKPILVSLVIGALFAWAMSTKLPRGYAMGTGAAAAAIMYGGFAYNGRLERREAVRRAQDEAEERA